MSNTSFGKNVLTNNFDPALLNGWGVRPSDWNLGVSIAAADSDARSSVDVTYTPPVVPRLYRRRQPARSQPSDLTPFSIVAPLDPRLPGGGGYVVSGLYDVVPGEGRTGRTTSSPTRANYGNGLSTSTAST